MQVQVSDAGTLRKRVSVSYSPAEVAARRDQLLRRLGSEVKLEGFRPGKAPRALLERRYGAAATAQTEESLADEGFNAAIREHKLRPFGRVQPEDTKRADGLVFTVAFEVFPEIKLPAATELTLDKSEAVVPDAEVDEAIQGIARRLGELTPLAADETLREDDSVTLTGSVKVGGAEVRALDNFHHLVGGYPLFGKPPAEVVAAFAGKKVGDTVAFTAILPASFTPAENAGKEAEVAVAIQSANRQRAATLDDALAQKVGAADVADLRSKLTERMKQRKNDELRMKQIDQLASQLVDKVQVELPPLALAEAIAGEEERAVAAAKERKEDEAKAKADAKTQVERGFRRHIILRALGDQLGIEVTNDDFRDQIMMAAQRTGRKPEDIAKQLQTSGQAQQVAMEIREAKALETFLDQVLGKEAAAAKA
jgi:trigger factor